MSQRFRFHWFSLLVFLLLPGVAHSAFSVLPIKIMISERGPVPGYEITEQTNKYQLIAPPMVEKVSVEESITKLTFKPNTGEFFMALQFTTNYLAAAGEKKLDVAKSRIVALFPDAEFLETGTTYTGNGAAFFYDFLWGAGHSFHSKIVVQEVEGRICELTLSAGRNDYAGHLPHFGNFLSSFHIIRK